MGLDQVLDRVAREGEARNAAVLHEAEAEAARLLEGAKAEGATITQAAQEAAEVELDRLRTHSRASAEMEAKKATLRERKAAIDATKEAFLAALEALDDTQRRTLYGKLIVTATKEIPKGGLSCAEGDTGLLGSHPYTKGPAISTSGGFVIDSTDGAFRLDLRFETLAERVWEANYRDTLEQLFE